MRLFGKQNVGELNQFFQDHNIHDARIRKTEYCAQTSTVRMEVCDLATGGGFRFEFEDVEAFTVKRDHFPGRNDEINYAGAEDETVCRSLNITERCYWLCFLFEQVSGGQIQIVAEDVLIEAY